MPEAARVTDSHSCPKHPSNTVLPKGEPSVVIASQPAARLSDGLSCGATIAAGEATVLIGGQPAARVGDASSHGGCVASGCSTVLIGKPAPENCLDSDSPLIQESASPSETSLSQIESGGGSSAISPNAEGIVTSESTIPELLQSSQTSSPLTENLLKVLGGEEVFDLIGGANNLNLVNQSLDIVGNTLTLMGKDNPLSEISGGLDLLTGNALTQLGGALTLMGEEKVGGAMKLLGTAVGGGDPTAILAGASHLVGEEKLSSILNLAGGNTSNLVNDVLKITGEDHPQDHKPVPVETKQDNDPFL